MSLGDIYTTTTPDSASKKNLFGVVSGSGTYLASLDKSKITLVFCTATGAGLTINHLYAVSADDSEFIDVTSTADHTHTGTTDGGEFNELFMSNPKQYNLYLTKTTDLYEASWASPVYWNRAVTSTGGTSNNTDGTTGERSIKLTTGATSGSGSTISYPHLQLDFSKRAIFQTKLRLETASSLAFHTGIACDDITAADSNTIKLQCEVCTTTNNNFWLRTASGSNNTASDTGVAISTNRVAVRIKHYPSSPESQLQIDTGTQLVKTTHIPTSGATADNNLIKHSIKNSTAADRPMHVYGTRLSYTVSDDWV
jgi:hypothetical protein